jgi:hypothetical protein
MDKMGKIRYRTPPGLGRSLQMKMAGVDRLWYQSAQLAAVVGRINAIRASRGWPGAPHARLGVVSEEKDETDWKDWRLTQMIGF